MTEKTLEATKKNLIQINDKLLKLYAKSENLDNELGKQARVIFFNLLDISKIDNDKERLKQYDKVINDNSPTIILNDNFKMDTLNSIVTNTQEEKQLTKVYEKNLIKTKEQEVRTKLFLEKLNSQLEENNKS